MAHPAPYTLKNIEEMLGLGRSVISRLIDAGFVSPVRGARNEWRFTFQDVVLLRTAHRLKAERISSRKLLQSLQQLKAKLPDEMPLAGLRIRAIGNDVAVRTADARWEADSGQLLMDFEVATSQGTVTFLERSLDRAAKPRTAAAWFEQGQTLEAADPPGAEEAYRQALALWPEHVEAAINLGALLCDRSEYEAAAEVFENALRHAPDSALLHFNLGFALEVQQRNAEALQRYEQSLALDPELADAHFNAARLHEMLGDPRSALRHYSAYRRLQNSQQSP
jgi:tetratricopeptide (TPR) repeat protein